MWNMRAKPTSVQNTNIKRDQMFHSTRKEEKKKIKKEWNKESIHCLLSGELIYFCIIALEYSFLPDWSYLLSPTVSMTAKMYIRIWISLSRVSSSISIVFRFLFRFHIMKMARGMCLLLNENIRCVKTPWWKQHENS